MTKYARIENGLVAEVFSTDQDIRELFHPSLVWVECPEGVKGGDAFDGQAFTTPSTQPTKSQRIAALTAEYKANVSALQVLWLAASVTGGASEATKKATIAQDLYDLKTQYTTDLNTIRNS